MIDSQHGWNPSFKPSFLGFVISIILVFSAHRIVTHHHLSNFGIMMTISGLAIAQVLIQLVFFLHLGLESKPRWNTITFLFTAMVVILVLGGSLWIMNNLDYNLMPTMGH